MNSWIILRYLLLLYINMDHLSEEQLGEFKEAFKFFDKDNDGQISKNDLEGVMRSLRQHCTEELLTDMIDDLDTDGNGSIDFPEFLTMMTRKMQRVEDRDEEIMTAFKIFDQNEDGFISVDELRNVMTHLGEKVTDDEINEMILEADENGDGKINYDEFRNMITPR